MCAARVVLLCVCVGGCLYEPTANTNKPKPKIHNPKTQKPKGAAADPQRLQPSELLLLTSLPRSDDEVVAFLTPRLGVCARVCLLLLCCLLLLVAWFFCVPALVNLCFGL